MAKKDPNFTIVYVLVPLECYDKYEQNESLKGDDEWLKIGETSYEGNIDELTIANLIEKTKSRVISTYLPVNTKIGDVYIFPYKQHTDDMVRARLTQEPFSLENSKDKNKGIEVDESTILAGSEFVYGASRQMVKYAVHSLEP